VGRFTGPGLVTGVTPVGFEDGMVPEDRLGGAEARGDDALFCDSRATGSLLG
jgi:hypothetical protein